MERLLTCNYVITINIESVHNLVADYDTQITICHVPVI